MRGKTIVITGGTSGIGEVGTRKNGRPDRDIRALVSVGAVPAEL